MGNVYIFFYLEDTRNTYHNFYNVIVLVLLFLLQCKISVNVLFFCSVLTPDKLEEAFERRALGICSYYWFNIVKPQGINLLLSGNLRKKGAA